MVQRLFVKKIFSDDEVAVADLNGDGIINVIDIVTLVNMILG